MVEYKERYLISPCGDVFDKKLNRFMTKQRQSLGYIQVSIFGKRMYMHRVVAEVFIPKPEGKTEIDHIDGNKWNNCVLNLRWVTKSENIKSSFLNGQNHTPMERVLKMNLARKSKKVIYATD